MDELTAMKQFMDVRTFAYKDRKWAIFDRTTKLVPIAGTNKYLDVDHHFQVDLLTDKIAMVENVVESDDKLRDLTFEEKKVALNLGYTVNILSPQLPPSNSNLNESEADEIDESESDKIGSISKSNNAYDEGKSDNFSESIELTPIPGTDKYRDSKLNFQVKVIDEWTAIVEGVIESDGKLRDLTPEEKIIAVKEGFSLTIPPPPPPVPKPVPDLNKLVKIGHRCYLEPEKKYKIWVSRKKEFNIEGIYICDVLFGLTEEEATTARSLGYEVPDGIINGGRKILDESPLLLQHNQSVPLQSSQTTIPEKDDPLGTLPKEIKEIILEGYSSSDPWENNILPQVGSRAIRGKSGLPPQTLMTHSSFSMSFPVPDFDDEPMIFGPMRFRSLRDKLEKYDSTHYIDPVNNYIIEDFDKDTLIVCGILENGSIRYHLTLAEIQKLHNEGYIRQGMEPNCAMELRKSDKSTLLSLLYHLDISDLERLVALIKDDDIRMRMPIDGKKMKIIRAIAANVSPNEIASKLRVSELKKALLGESIRFPSKIKKETLVKLFKDSIH